MQIEEIQPGVLACLMDNETANAGAVITERGVVVIDTLASPAHGRSLASAIQERTDRPILFVINTHYHYDHVLGNQAFDAPVIAHVALAQELAEAAARDLSPVALAARISAHPEDRWLAEELEIAYPQLLFQQRLVLELPPLRMVLQHLGGHTPDSLVVDLPEKGVLFAGDLVFEGRVPYLRSAHIGDTLQALGRLEQLEARTVVPGHGALCDLAYVTRTRDYLERLRSSVADQVARGRDLAKVLDSEELPSWWTEDRPDLMRANVARVYDEVLGATT